MRIIIVEDEERARKGLVSLIQLAPGGHEVVAQAMDGKQGFELIRKLHPDLVFTDIQMPLMDGLELIRMIREQKINTQVVIVSAYEEFEYARTAISYGVQEYIVKPIIFEDVENVLKRVEAAVQASPQEAREKPLDSGGVHPCVTKAIAILEKEYAGHLTQDELAERLRVTPQYFSYLFHRDTGMNFSAYLKEYRINMAKNLLDTTDMKVYDVAEATGYTDTKYFCRVFKSVMGISPTDYIRRQT